MRKTEWERVWGEEGETDKGDRPTLTLPESMRNSMRSGMQGHRQRIGKEELGLTDLLSTALLITKRDSWST